MKKGKLSRLRLDIGMKQLSDPELFDQVLFWGRLTGEQSNYYIALALKFNEYEFPLKKFYYATEDFVFKPLPSIIEQFKDKVEEFNGEFSGNPTKVLWEDTSEPAEEEEEQKEEVKEPVEGEEKLNESLTESEDEGEKKVELVKQFYEIDRLAYVIRAIEIECAILPVGSLKLSTSHTLGYNKRFQGHDLKDALKTQNWMHFRQPLFSDKKEEMEKPEAVFKKDLLDPIDFDLPKNCWSLQNNMNKDMAFIRNFKWPGFIGYHWVNSRFFGYCYFGDGVKNVELNLLI